MKRKWMVLGGMVVGWQVALAIGAVAVGLSEPREIVLIVMAYLFGGISIGTVLED